MMAARMLFPRHPVKNYRAAVLTLAVHANLQQVYEHLSHDDWRMGRPQEYAAGAEWARSVPLVHAGSAGPPLHLLFGILRSRVEAALSAWVFARTHIEAGRRSVRSLWRGYDQRARQAQTLQGICPRSLDAPLGTQDPD